MNKNMFSIAIESDDFAFISILQAVASFCQSEKTDETADGSMEELWMRDNHKVSFYFTRKEYRTNFIHVVNAFPKNHLWKIKDLNPQD